MKGSARAPVARRQRSDRVSASLSDGHLTRPKSGQVRSVPMDPEVATALARLGQRGRWTGDDDFVFPGISGDHSGCFALWRRFVASEQNGHHVSNSDDRT